MVATTSWNLVADTAGKGCSHFSFLNGKVGVSLENKCWPSSPAAWVCCQQHIAMFVVRHGAASWPSVASSRSLPNPKCLFIYMPDK